MPTNSKEYAKEYRRKNREKMNTYRYAWNKRNPDKVRVSANRWSRKNPAKKRKYTQTYRRKLRALGKTLVRNKSKDRNSALIRKFGITYHEWNHIFLQQGNVCACCGTTDPGTKNGWSTDHDHVTGAVRGIVCAICNRGGGGYMDTVEGAYKRWQYLIHGATRVAAALALFRSKDWHPMTTTSENTQSRGIIHVTEQSTPARVHHAATWWFATGRRGVFAHPQTYELAAEVAEYECGDADRVWAFHDGVVATDYEVSE